MVTLHKPIWIQSGIFEAIKASTYKISKNPSLILSLSQKWNPKTKTFVFPWGEATITLEDVTLLLGFSVLGSSVYTPLETPEMKESVLRLEKRRQESAKQVSWISSFEDDQMEHEAFLVFWLSNFVFPGNKGCSVSKNVFSIAVRLARGERIALAPAVLASLYRDLGRIRAFGASTPNVNVKSLFKLVQVWILERFKSLGPRPQVIPKGEPRISRWSGLKQRAVENVMRPFLVDDFDWRPYTKPLRNWNPQRFYNKKTKSDDEFARCVRVSKLDGLGVMEDYYPNRVAMQFGLAQDPTKHISNFREKEACEEDCNRPLDGSKKRMASRLTTASVSAAKYRDWWMKSVKEPTETFNASYIGDDDDDDDDDEDDVPLKILPLSQVFQKLGDGKKKAEQLINKKRKRASEDDNENAMDCCEPQDEDDDDDDNVTIAQRIKCRKKCGDGKDTGDQIIGTEEDPNAPGLPQKLASGDEHNYSDSILASGAVDEMEEDNNITIAQIVKLRKKCDSVENTEGGEYAYGGLEVDHNVSGLPQNLACGDVTVAVPEIKQKNEDNDETNSLDPLVVSNGIAEKEEEVDDERLNQRKFGTDELAMKLEARMLKVEKILAEIRQWKMGNGQTKTPVCA